MSKLRITPIGTCRVHTPLRRAAGRYPIGLDLRRNYGFVHSSEEALQLVRFLQGDKQFRPEVAPLVFRDGDLARFEGEEWQPSDLHVVEVSSSKRYVSGPDTVQGNYVVRHFADFFASNERSRNFWLLVKKGHRADLINYLREQPSYRQLPAADRELLASLGLERQSFKAVKADMEEIVERLGRDRVLFMTHVNAMTPDDELIPHRDGLIRWVKMAAEQLEAAVFDPTPSMHEFGQERALEKAGLDLAHFTSAFSDKVYEDLHRSQIGSLIGARFEAGDAEDAEAQVEMLATNLEMMLEIGDWFATAKEIHAVVERRPDALPLIELRGMIRSRIGDFRGAVSDLTKRDDDREMSLGMRTALLRALTEIGDYSRARKVAENLISDEFENAEIYRDAATAAEQTGQVEEAVGFAKQAFRKDRDDLASALHALVLLIQTGQSEVAEEWRKEILENIGTAGSGAFEVGMWAVREGDQDLLTAVLPSVAAVDKGAVIDLLEDAFKAGMTRAVADAVLLAAALGRLSRSLAERRSALYGQLLAEGEALLKAHQTADAFAIARSIVALEDVSSTQIATVRLATLGRRLMRFIVNDVRLSIRDAYKRRASDEVLRAGERAGHMLLDHVDIAIIVARTLRSSGRTKEALELMKQTQSQNPDSFAAARWTARLAASESDYTTALLMYDKLRRSSDPELQTISSEVEEFFGVSEGRALRKLRQLVVHEEYDDALALAQAFREVYGPHERVERELRRMHRALRLRLMAINEEDGEAEDREPILRRIILLRPADPAPLRDLARELMRQYRFAEAAEAWTRLHALDPRNVEVVRSRDRCVKMAERRRGLSASALGVAA